MKGYKTLRSITWVLILVLSFLTMGVVCACEENSRYKESQTLYFEGCGTLAIPLNWKCEIKDDIYYIYDEESKPVLIEIGEDFSKPMTNKFYSDYVVEELISNVGLSNGAQYGKYLITYDGKQEEMMFIMIPSFLSHFDSEEKDSTVTLLVWDKTLTKKELDKIAQSFSNLTEQEKE